MNQGKLEVVKILQASLQYYVNWELPYVQDLEKTEEPEVQLPTSNGA